MFSILYNTNMLGLAKSILLLLTSGLHCGHASLTVTTPEEDLVVVSGRTFTVRWNQDDGSTTYSRFAIDLYQYQSYAMDEDSCGSWVTALCPYGERGCPDSTGDYDVVLPEPATDLPDSTYRIGVLGVEDGSFGCSDKFTLTTEQATSKDPDKYFLSVTAPADGDVAVIGDTYEVQFSYENGVGSSADVFDIDLFTSDCGTYVAGLCDQCKDSGGSHPIIIPMDTDADFYRIRVARVEDPFLFDCSGVFEVVDILSFSFW
ncbi:unnamed protein product [Ectocarpus sp. 4 AP-2014]|uniref:EsV-1-163 n=1 Tax=Ectocarpus siliculosus virus 1 (isolate New Zealand/Kaikoura/1988) TaxID=654926 RepID=Q8QKV3_ESV1K|nr:EsV-1-163 [Ectocarpus siliculosus virus 1]AAK14577.1 EsV-1-163 [Ectocarpus siliculosus virus 1]